MSNRGVPKPKTREKSMIAKLDCSVYFALDWVRFTYDINTPLESVWQGHPCFEPDPRSVTTMPAYNTTMTLRCGRIDWHSERPENKRMMTMTGEDLTRARAMGLNERMMLCHFFDQPDVHFTRVDIAADLYGGERKNLISLYNAVLSEKAVCRAKRIHKIESHNQKGEDLGKSVYIGSRTSETMMRVYDKARETKMLDTEWTRVELELKNRQADAAAWAISLHGSEKVFRDMATRYLNSTGVAWYEALLRDLDAPRLVEEPGRKITNFERWVREVCLPAIQKAVADGMPGVREALEFILQEGVENA